MKRIFVLSVVFIIMLSFWAAGEEARVRVECVQGLKPGTTDTVFAGQQLRFDFTYINGYDAAQYFSNCYSLSSPDSVSWSNIDFARVDGYAPNFPLSSGLVPYVLNGETWDGISPDFFRLASLVTPFGDSGVWKTGPYWGYGPLWNIGYVVCYLTFNIDFEQAGKHIVLDSMSVTGYTWVWSQISSASGTTANIRPDWGGPYEYYIAYAPAGEVNVDYSQDSGFTSTGDIIAARKVTFPLTYSSELNWDFSELINCYQLSSPNGIFWTDLETLPYLENIGDLAAYVLSPHPDDIVGLRFLADEGDKLEAPFEINMGYLTFKTVAEDVGKTIILDYYFDVGETWIWFSHQAPEPPGYIEPAWLGQITLMVAPCCYGTTGNVDCSSNEEPDISDITRLIDFLYISHGELCCPAEADVNISGGNPDITDITALIDHLYLAHEPLVACPESVQISGKPDLDKARSTISTSGLKLNWVSQTTLK
ncbi:MAG: hypothetical protein PHU88_03545 [candidate division Zixibacteria bacterium]|nr:hypothetical protein [candidate division Zixibacteria bacterium]MDD5425199.1 hypothetical protein [candidate division Zixibacteria bacterium]